jgi:hypothetical protein
MASTGGGARRTPHLHSGHPHLYAQVPRSPRTSRCTGSIARSPDTAIVGSGAGRPPPAQPPAPRSFRLGLTPSVARSPPPLLPPPTPPPPLPTKSSSRNGTGCANPAQREPDLTAGGPNPPTPTSRGSSAARSARRRTEAFGPPLAGRRLDRRLHGHQLDRGSLESVKRRPRHHFIATARKGPATVITTARTTLPAAHSGDGETREEGGGWRRRCVGGAARVVRAGDDAGVTARSSFPVQLAYGRFIIGSEEKCKIGVAAHG